MKQALSGRVKLRVFSPDGKLVEERPWGDNLITDQGLDWWSGLMAWDRGEHPILITSIHHRSPWPLFFTMVLGGSGSPASFSDWRISQMITAQDGFHYNASHTVGFRGLPDVTYWPYLGIEESGNVTKFRRTFVVWNGQAERPDRITYEEVGFGPYFNPNGGVVNGVYVNPPTPTRASTVAGIGDVIDTPLFSRHTYAPLVVSRGYYLFVTYELTVCHQPPGEAAAPGGTHGWQVFGEQAAFHPGLIPFWWDIATLLRSFELVDGFRFYGLRPAPSGHVASGWLTYTHLPYVQNSFEHYVDFAAHMVTSGGGEYRNALLLRSITGGGKLIPGVGMVGGDWRFSPTGGDDELEVDSETGLLPESVKTLPIIQNIDSSGAPPVHPDDWVTKLPTNFQMRLKFTWGRSC